MYNEAHLECKMARQLFLPLRINLQSLLQSCLLFSFLRLKDTSNPKKKERENNFSSIKGENIFKKEENPLQKKKLFKNKSDKHERKTRFAFLLTNHQVFLFPFPFPFCSRISILSLYFCKSLKKRRLFM